MEYARIHGVMDAGCHGGWSGGAVLMGVSGWWLDKIPLESSLGSTTTIHLTSKVSNLFIKNYIVYIYLTLSETVTIAYN